MDKNRANVKKKCFSLGYQSSRFKFRLNKADRWRSKPAWLKRLEPWDGFWETIQRWTERANLNNYKWIWSPREINVAFHKEKNIFIQPPNCKLCKFYRDSLWTKRPFLLFHPLNRPYMQQTMNKRAKLNNSQMVWRPPETNEAFHKGIKKFQVWPNSLPCSLPFTFLSLIELYSFTSCILYQSSLVVGDHCFEASF